MSAKRILFVCTGNSCRSVMAEELLRHMLQRAGVTEVQVESAGVFAVDGMESTRETQRILQEAGVECDAHRAQSLTVEMVQSADLVLAMEPFQLEEVVRRVPSGKGKVHLLKTFGVSTGPEWEQPAIPDPIGKPLEVYEVCFREIQSAVERVAKSLGLASA